MVVKTAIKLSLVIQNEDDLSRLRRSAEQILHAMSALEQYRDHFTLFNKKSIASQLEALRRDYLILKNSLDEYARNQKIAQKTKSPLIINKEQLLSVYPQYQRITTDIGYDCGYPVYLASGGSAPQDIIAYDCSDCSGIIIGKPNILEWSFYRTKIECRFCFKVIFDRENDYGS